MYATSVHSPTLLPLSLLSRLEWPKDHYFPPWTLRFRDGWEPPALPYVPQSREQELTQLAQSLANAEIQRQGEETLRLAQEVRETPILSCLFFNKVKLYLNLCTGK